MIEAAFLSQLVVAGVTLICALILGFLFERYLLIKLKKIADTTRWECDEIIVCALRGRMIHWAFLAGLYSMIAIIKLPDEITGFSRNALFVLFVLSVTATASDIAVGVINIYARKRQKDFPSTSIFTNLTIVILFIIGVLIIMQSLGISVTPVLTALGVGGLAVALALQDTLSNFFAGLHILFSRPVRPGDYIRLDTGEEGYIVDITWRNTSMRDFHENMVVVPNSKMASANIVNYALPEKETIIIIPVRISYCSDLPKVEQVTSEVAREVMAEVPGGVPDYVPLIRFHSFEEYYILINVIVCVQEFGAQFIVRHEFIKRLFARYQAENIKIALPVQSVRLQVDEMADTFNRNLRS